VGKTSLGVVIIVVLALLVIKLVFGKSQSRSESEVDRRCGQDIFANHVDWFLLCWIVLWGEETSVERIDVTSVVVCRFAWERMWFQELVCVLIAVDEDVEMERNLRQLIYPSGTSSLQY
jgi:hypothetical protein